MVQVNPFGLNITPASSVNGSAKLNNAKTPTIQQPSKDTFQKVSDAGKKSGKASKKKVGKAVLIGAAVFGLAAGAAILVASQIRKGKLLGAESAKKYADNIQKQAENIRQEVVELFNNRGMKDGKQVAEITEENGISIMKEVFGESSSRESTFINSVLDSVEVTTKKGKNLFQFLKDGKLSKYKEGYEKLEKGGYKATKILSFDDGKLYEYIKDYVENADASWGDAKALYFDDGKLCNCMKGRKVNKNGNLEIAKEFDFEDGKLYEYIKDYVENADGSLKIAKKFDFEDGKPTYYIKGYEEIAGKVVKVKKMISFVKDKLLPKVERNAVFRL